MEGAATTADAVYEILRQSILDGEFVPGQRLLSDALATEFKISRTPVREALRKLEAEGLIEASRSGLIVRELSEEDLTELFVVREALEGMVARLAAENASRAMIDELHALLDELKDAATREDARLFRGLTGEFHLALCRAARNKRLMQDLKVLLDQVRQAGSSTLFLKGRPLKALEEYRRLVEAIEARDADLAERLAREHRRRTLALRKEMLRDQVRQNRALEHARPAGRAPSRDEK
jgi:DNA-binding GntR family transcriptional regulator